MHSLCRVHSLWKISYSSSQFVVCFISKYCQYVCLLFHILYHRIWIVNRCCRGHTWLRKSYWIKFWRNGLFKMDYFIWPLLNQCLDIKFMHGREDSFRNSHYLFIFYCCYCLSARCIMGLGRWVAKIARFYWFRWRWSSPHGIWLWWLNRNNHSWTKTRSYQQFK
jgi:hypothetical protein